MPYLRTGTLKLTSRPTLHPVSFAPGEAEVGEQLRLMHRLKRFHGLKLNDDFPRDDEIQAITAVKVDTLVFQR